MTYIYNNYIKDGTIPKPITNNTQAHLKQLATKYIIIADVLYRRSFDEILLRYLKNSKINMALD